MGFFSWLTGRDAKESDVYLDQEKVSAAVNEINSSAQEAVNAAIQQLNNVNGLAQYVGFNVPSGAFDGVFTSSTEAIKHIAEQIQNKADNVKAYNDAAWYEKLGSTFAMAGAKTAEGALSVLEDIGDAALSIYGFVSGAEWVEDAIKKEWSHDAFNFYYNSDFAKASAFTEDSAAAGAFKIIGKTAGTLYASGVLAGATGLSGVSAGAGFLHTSGTTWAATAVNAASGLGSGTEAGLSRRNNWAAKAVNAAEGEGLTEKASARETIAKSMFTDGAKSAAIQGGLAYFGGRLGEHMSYRALAKEGVDVDALKAAEDAYGSAMKAAKTAAEKEAGGCCKII